MPTPPKASKRRGKKAQWSRGANDQKQGNKKPDLTLNRAIARRDAAQAVIDRLTSPQSAQATRTRAVEEDDEADDDSEQTASDSEKRVVVAYFYKTECHCAPEEDWSGRDGTIAHIRRRIKGARFGHGAHMGRPPTGLADR
jgi:hypothetical protein